MHMAIHEIKRVQGGARGRSSGSAAGGFAWAVATSDIVYIADSLPRTATGKIQRRHMVAAFAGDK